MALPPPPPAVYWPAEWAPHAATWAAYPSDPDLWGEDLAPAQAEVEGLMAALLPHESVHLLVAGAELAAQVRRRLGPHPHLHLEDIPYGDVWLRDTGPIFVQRDGALRAAQFAFNGWGNKYVFPHDDALAGHIAARAGVPGEPHPWVLEGGSVDGDGEGTVLTTRQCLLNPNRNPDLDQAAIERHLAAGLGARQVIWLGDGLINDHTDGHVDTVARFVRPGVVVCMRPATPEDPNAAALAAIEATLRRAHDARGRQLEVVTLPAPGRVVDAAGELRPASYVNFYIGNQVVVMPTYGVPQDGPAQAALARLFPAHTVVGRPAQALLSGGGAFHCMTQQQPQGGGSAGAGAE